MNLSRRQFFYHTGLTAAGLAAIYSSTTSALASSNSHSEADLSTWTGVKEQFAVSPDYVHLASFFLASHPRPVREAIESYRAKLDADPIGQVEAGPSNKTLYVETALAKYIGGKPEEIALTDSTTMGLALIYHGLPLKAGQEILTTVHDHYSHHESIRLAAERAGASVRKIKLFDDYKSISSDEIVARIR